MMSQRSDMTSLSYFFDVVVFLLSSLVTGPSLLLVTVNIGTGSGVMTIFVYKGFTRNPEITNTPVLVLRKIWRLGQVRDTKFGTNVSNKMLLNAAKCQGCSFYRFCVIKGEPTGWVIYYPPPPTHTHPSRLGLKN